MGGGGGQNTFSRLAVWCVGVCTIAAPSVFVCSFSLSLSLSVSLFVNSGDERAADSVGDHEGAAAGSSSRKQQQQAAAAAAALPLAFLGALRRTKRISALEYLFSLHVLLRRLPRTPRAVFLSPPAQSSVVLWCVLHSTLFVSVSRSSVSPRERAREREKEKDQLADERRARQSSLFPRVNENRVEKADQRDC